MTITHIRLAAGLSFLVFACLLSAAPTFVHAAPPASPGITNTLQGGLDAAAQNTGLKTGEPSKDLLPAIIGRIINAALTLLGVVLLGYFLYGGYMWMTAGGETKKVETATTTIRNAIIGLIVILLSYAASTYVIQTVGKALAP